MAKLKLILDSLPYLKKDILWVLVLVAIFFLIGRSTLTFPEINNIIFIIFAFIVWRKKNLLNNKGNSILSVGRVLSLNAFVVILFFLIYPLLSNLQLLTELIFDKLRLVLLLGLIIYALQYYLFTLWKTKYDFKTQKKLIFIELAGLIIIYFFTWNRFLI